MERVTPTTLSGHTPWLVAADWKRLAWQHHCSHRGELGFHLSLSSATPLLLHQSHSIFARNNLDGHGCVSFTQGRGIKAQVGSWYVHTWANLWVLRFDSR